MQTNKMSESKSKEMLYGNCILVESVRVMAESNGVSSLPDECAKDLAELGSAYLMELVQDAKKFMVNGKRDVLTCNDIFEAIKLRNLEPQYGFIHKDSVPFRFASGGGRELYFTEEKDVNLTDTAQFSTAKVPHDVALRSHWLAVDGIQPTIPENPPPLSKDKQLLEAVNPAAKLDQGISKETASKPTAGKLQKLKNVETVHVKQLATHELSVEQQLYYKEITEASVGSDEARRLEALQSLSSDPGLHEMLPRMCTFIAEGIKVNVVQNNLAILIYLMRMVKALLDNQSLYLEKYLHELIPAVITCIVSKQLCARPEVDNHWALRDFASRLISQICKNFNNTTNNLQTRVTRIFSKAMQNDKTALPSLYGAIAALSELGGEVIKGFIVPKLKFISDRIECHLSGSSQSNTDKTAAGHIRAMLQRCCPAILKQIRAPPDIVEEYKNDYGFLGVTLFQGVVKARTVPGLVSTSAAAPASFTALSSAAQNTNSTTVTRIAVPVSHRSSPTPSTLTPKRLSAVHPQKYLILTPTSSQPQVQTLQAQGVSAGSATSQTPMIISTISSVSSATVANTVELVSDNNERAQPMEVEESVIIESEVRAPPEVDDLSHLE